VREAHHSTSKRQSPRAGRVCVLVASFCIALIGAGCSRAPLNPPRLVMGSNTDMAVQLFMQATILLSNQYGYSTIRYADLQARSRRAGLDMLPFMAPETVRATPELVNFLNDYDDNPDRLKVALQQFGGYKNLVKYYIRTGLRASQSICRNYLLDLDEKSEYLEFIQKEVGVGYALSSAVLALVNANTTLTTSFLIARTGFDGAIDAYQDYRFLNIDREAARSVVEAAQNALAKYHLDQVDNAIANANVVTGGYTFSDALHAVSAIEFQCTRSGIKSLLTRSVHNTPANIAVDKDTGNITFLTAVSAPVDPAPSGNPVTTGNPGSKPSGPPSVAQPCGQIPPDDTAKQLLQFLCPNGKAINNDRRTALENLRPDLTGTIVTVLTEATPEQAAVRKNLLALFKTAVQQGKITP
jgi:hypothetical protein